MSKTQNERPETYVKTGEVRVFYCFLTTPRDNEDGEPKYSAMLVIPKKDKKTIADINKAIEAAVKRGITEKWAGKKPKNLRLPLRDGDDEEKEGCEDSMFLNANRPVKKKAPAVFIKRDGELERLEDADAIYSGMYAKFTLEFFPYDTAAGKGVGVAINNVLKTRDGERLGGGYSPSATEDFEDEEDSDLDDDMADM